MTSTHTKYYWFQMSVEMAVTCIIGFSHGLKKVKIMWWQIFMIVWWENLSCQFRLFASFLGGMLSCEIHFKICYREEFEQFKIHRMDFSPTCYFWVANCCQVMIIITWSLVLQCIHQPKKRPFLADIWNRSL